MDSQSVKNTDSAENKGYDSGKKVSGIKRHIAVDTQGLPHAIHVTTANVTDRAGALAMFDRRRANLSQVQNVLVDGGYTGKPFATAVQSLLGASVEVVKRNELHTFVVLPKRWVVERSFGWLEKCRRLWKNCERKLNTSLQMAVLAFAVLGCVDILVMMLVCQMLSCQQNNGTGFSISCVAAPACMSLRKKIASDLSRPFCGLTAPAPNGGCFRPNTGIGTVSINDSPVGLTKASGNRCFNISPATRTWNT